MRKGEGKIQKMKSFWVAGFLALAAGGVWGGDKAKEEKKEEPAGLSQEENVKVGRGMAFQAFAAEQAEEWRAARDLYTAARILPREAGGYGSGPLGFREGHFAGDFQRQE
jgi:hypothetical protein